MTNITKELEKEIAEGGKKEITVPLADVVTISKYQSYMDAYINGEEEEYLSELAQQMPSYIEEFGEKKSSHADKLFWAPAEQFTHSTSMIPSHLGSFTGKTLNTFEPLRVIRPGEQQRKDLGLKMIDHFGDKIRKSNKEFHQVKTKLEYGEEDDFEYQMALATYDFASQFGVSGGSGLIAKLFKLKPEQILKLQKYVSNVYTGAKELSSAEEQNINHWDFVDQNIGTPLTEKNMQDVLVASGKAIASIALEHYVGFGKMLELRSQSAKEWWKNIGAKVASEGGSEGLTTFAQAGIDFATGRIDTSKLPEVFKEAVMATIIGGILGGTIGVHDVARHKQLAFSILDDRFGYLIPAEDKHAVFNQIYKAEEQTLRTVLDSMITHSKHLKEKHGEVYTSLLNAISLQVRDVGAFEGMSESQKAVHLQLRAIDFADKVLAEATLRKVPVSDVVEATDISYDPKTKEVYLRGKYFSEGSNTYNQAVGENANLSESQRVSLERAKELSDKGLSNQDVFNETGWYKGADGKFRTQVSDKDATVDDDVFDFLKNNQTVVRLRDLLQHRKLFDLYPEMENVVVVVDHDGTMLGDGTVAGFSYATEKMEDVNAPTIVINKNADVSDLKGTILHEIQHYIQRREGFATGGNTRSFDKVVDDYSKKITEAVFEHQREFEAKLLSERFGVKPTKSQMKRIHDDIFNKEKRGKASKNLYIRAGLDRAEVDAFLLSQVGLLKEEASKVAEQKIKELKLPAENNIDYYKRLYGEVEARNTEARMNMTDEELRASYPESTQDVSDADAIVVFDDGTQVSYKVSGASQEMIHTNNLVRKAEETGATIDETRALNENRNVLEFNLETLNDEESMKYMEEIATKKYGVSKKDFDMLVGKVKEIAEISIELAKENGNKRFTEWNKKSQDRYINALGNLVPRASSFKTNGDYPLNMDLSTLCTKRYAMNVVLTHLVKNGHLQQLGATQIDAIKDILRIEGIATPCDVCFVEAKRFRQLAYANTFAYEWESVRIALGISDTNEVGTPREFTAEQQQILDEMTAGTKKERNKAFNKYIPRERRREKLKRVDIDAGITPDKMFTIAKLFKSDPTLAGVFNPEWLMTTSGTDWLFRTYSHTDIRSAIASMYGSATPKPSEGFNIYDPLSWRLIYDTNNKGDKLEKVYAIGGFRGQSFSDFNAIQTLDYLQFFLDLSLRGLPAHMYTKVPAVIELFGETGCMFNMSLVPEVLADSNVPAGLTADGEYAWSKDSFPIEEAKRLRVISKYKGRVGTIAVGVSDQHILKMLDDPEIDMIIPYHASGMPVAIKNKTGLNRATDYENVQRTGGLKKKDSDYSFNEKLREIGDSRKTADDYLKWCAKNGYTPKFKQFAHHKNYYKLLEDFRGYDNDENPVIQSAVNINNIDANSFVETLGRVLQQRESEVNKQENIVVSKNALRKIDKLMSKQRIDGQYRDVFIGKIKSAIGKNNVVSLRQEEFFTQMEKDLEGSRNSKEAIRVYRNNGGFVYGYAKNKKIILNENLFNANTPAHEFTHLWSDVARKVNPKLWKKGKDLLKQSEVWNDVMSDELYLSIRNDEDLVASEVLARIVGRENEELIRKAIDPQYKALKSKEGITSRILSWFKELWGNVRSVFDFKANGKPLTYEEFIHMPLKDLWDETRHMDFIKTLSGIESQENMSFDNEVYEDAPVIGEIDTSVFKDEKFEFDKGWDKRKDFKAFANSLADQLVEAGGFATSSVSQSDKSEATYIYLYAEDKPFAPNIKIRLSTHAPVHYSSISTFYYDLNKTVKENMVDLNNLIAGKKYGAISTGREQEAMIRNVYGDTDLWGNRFSFDGLEDNVFEQRAFVGSPVNWENDRPSLEFIGTGEGNQAHGWGLYYALKRYVAEEYRKAFLGSQSSSLRIQDKSIGDFLNGLNGFIDYYDGGLLLLENNPDMNPKETFIKALNEYISDFRKNYQRTKFDVYKKAYEKAEIIKAQAEKLSDSDFVIKQWGQVYEVEIPENPYLLDEQKSFDEQSDFVKKGITSALKELKQRVTSGKYPYYVSALKDMDYDYYGIEQKFSNKTFYKNKSGKTIYNIISEIMGSDKDASLLLEKYGIKGITYEGARDGRCFVIFNPDDVQVIDKFYQAQMVNDVVTAPQQPRQKKVVKGTFSEFKKSIGITKDADASTYAHEFSHFWVDSIWEHIESGDASEEYIKRFEGVMKYIGAERGKKLTREQHEKFARAYEKYLFTAEVPRGVNPDVFDEYETFIRDVYDDITQIDTRYGETYEPITEEVYNFFNSMTRDPLPRPRYLAEDVEFMKRQEEQLDKDVEEVQTERNKVIEARATFDEQDNVVSEELKEKAKELGIDVGENGTYTMQPVQTDNKTGFLTAYKKTTGQEVEAGAMEQEAELKRATEFVNNNPELAEKIVMGDAPHPTGYSKNAIYIAYDRLQKKLGNTDKRADALINQALELRAMGQEISIQRLVYGVDPAQFINAIVNERTDKVAKRNGIKTRKELSDKIKEGVKKGLNEGKTPDQIVDEMARGLALKPKPKSEKEPDTSIYGYKKALKYVEERLGVGMSKDEAVNIIRIVDDMNRNLENAKSKNQNPTIEYFIKLKELEDYVNTLAPSSNLRILVSVIGKANLLASVKSPVTNVVANIPTNLIMAGTRRVRLGVMNSIVDAELTKRAKKEAWDIYKKTGFYIFSMDDPRRGTKQLLSENITNTSGSGLIRAYGRFMENLIFHWSMGSPDVMFKNFTFVDYASLKATKLANGDKARANELFEDACRIVPLTKEGKEIRNEAIQESLVATYQNNSWLSEKALKVRGSLDFGVGFGEIISPFVKTPANVIGTGLRYSFGGIKAIASEVVRGVQRGGFKLSDVTPENRSLLMDNTIGFLVSLALASLFDDEDYMPPYVLATTKERQLAKELNIAYNSIRIGDTWYSLDYFGVLASPLVSILQARRSEGIAGSVAGFVKGGGVQALSIPGFANVSEVWENIENTLRKEPEKAYSDIAGDFVEGVYNRAVPMIVSDIAKATDDYEREAKTTEERIQSKIPVLREDLPEKVSVTTGRPEEMGNAFLDIVAGSRVKPQLINDVADEFKRLSDAGYGVQLTDVTQRGALSELEPEDKQQVREDFAKEYSRLVGNLIRGATYRRATDEEKSEMINKIRSKITRQLRDKYKNRRVK